VKEAWSDRHFLFDFYIEIVYDYLCLEDDDDG